MVQQSYQAAVPRPNYHPLTQVYTKGPAQATTAAIVILSLEETLLQDGRFHAKSSTLAENQKISIDWFKNTRNVRGVYGFGEVVEKEISVGANPKTGMDTEEFEKYLTNRIMPLYPDAKDEPGKHVAVIVDSGSGRVNLRLLAKMRINGFYLIPGVTQATDQNNGWFKSIYRNNLTKLRAHSSSSG